jgi:hypothetical protein
MRAANDLAISVPMSAIAKKPVPIRRAAEHAKQQRRPVKRNKVRNVGKALYRLRHK